MKIAFFATSLILAFGSFSLAANDSCDQKCIVQKSLIELKEHVADISKTGRQDIECPKAGIEILGLKEHFDGGLMSGKLSLLPQVNVLLVAKEKTLNSDGSKCGSCRQTNQTTVIVNSFPQPVTPAIDFCKNQPTQLFRQEFTSRQDAADYAVETVKGNGRDGKKLLAGCPDPCSFYVMTATTQLPTGKTRLNLSVRCDQPRDGSAFFATYHYSGNLIHEWTCTK